MARSIARRSRSSAACIRQHASASVNTRQHPSASVSIRQHTSVSVRHLLCRQPRRCFFYFYGGRLRCRFCHFVFPRQSSARRRAADLDVGVWVAELLQEEACERSSIRQQTSAYVGIRQRTSYVSIRQHTLAYVSIRAWRRRLVSVAVAPSSPTSAYVSIRQHTLAYVSIRAWRRRRVSVAVAPSSPLSSGT
jgi:hypothetical protein